ncbi:MAG: glycosyltransferase, partial [Myxococcota bacterium]
MPRPTLSLCMIVRDEATMLPDCLASVRGIVDQIVIVDTGSKDRTREIGEAAGAVVIEHPWQGNFAAARNAALPHATGDFILILDADERLAPTAGNVLHAAVQDPTFHLGFLPLHNADRLNATPEQILSGAARRGDPVLLPRLLKKTPDLQWQGIVHENVDAWILKDGRRAVEVPAPIIHLGNVDEISIARKKTERNTTLLARAVALSPEDPQLRSWLARELLRTGQADRARQEAEVAWKSMVTALNAGLKPAVVLTASLVGFLRLEDNDWDGVLEVINTTAPYAGDHPNLFLLEGVARQQRAAEGDLERAAQVLRQAIAQHGKMFTAESMPGATSWSARMQLGFVALRAGAPEQALAQFSEALSANPEQIHSRLGAAESLAAMGRHGDALQVVEPALPTGGSDGWIIAAAAAAAP